MLRRTVVLVLAWHALAIILSGCCNCPGAGSFRFRWTSLDIAVHPYSLDSGYVAISPDSTTDFMTRNPVFETTLDYELIARRHHCSGLLNQAYACSCAEDQFHPEKNITTLRVYTLNAYDPNHPAMSDVTDYFSELYYEATGSRLQAMRQPVAQPYYSGSARLAWAMYLDQRPTVPGYQQFRVVYTLTDSSRIAADTAPLLF